jgi:hypothetical protein
MADETPENGRIHLTPYSASARAALSIAKSSLSNGASSVISAQEILRQKSIEHSHAVKAILSRTGIAKSEGLLRTIGDTPPTAPASPRLGP